MRLVDGSWCWVVVGVGIGELSGVRVFGWKGVGGIWGLECWARVGVGIGGLLAVRVFGWRGVGNLGIGILGQG